MRQLEIFLFWAGVVASGGMVALGILLGRIKPGEQYATQSGRKDTTPRTIVMHAAIKWHTEPSVTWSVEGNSRERMEENG